MVDSHDRQRFDEAANELHSILRDSEFPQYACLLVLANKQDLPKAANAKEVANALHLDTLRNRNWYCQATQAITGDGLSQGFEWLAKEMDKQSKYLKKIKLNRRNK